MNYEKHTELALQLVEEEKKICKQLARKIADAHSELITDDSKYVQLAKIIQSEVSKFVYDVDQIVIHNQDELFYLILEELD